MPPRRSVLNNKAIIGFGGYAFAGKDEAAKVLNLLGWKTTYMSKTLRQSLLALNPIIDGSTRYRDLDESVGYEAAKKNPEVRALLQRLGTEVGRNIYGENFWVDHMKKEVAEYTTDGYSVAITGIRYLNELEAIWEIGGVNVWVDRPGFNAMNDHTSENTLTRNHFDATLCNDGTLEDLRIATDRLRWAVLTGLYNN